MHEKNIALLCDEADRLLQLNINLLRQMVDEPDVLLDGKNENGLLFDKRKALKRIEELEGEQIKTARREMVLAVVGTMKAGKSTTINAIVGKEILPNRNRPMTSVPTLIRHVPGKNGTGPPSGTYSARPQFINQTAGKTRHSGRTASRTAPAANRGYPRTTGYSGE